jgi:eukaryotic-like serine/threonine-protein kinase
VSQESIGGHTLLRRICQTASSDLFVAVDRRRREEVVLKVVLPKLAREKKTLRHYAREVQVCGTMDHPNLTRIYDYVDSAERPYIVMRFIPGQMLKAAIYREADLVRRLGFHWLVRTSQALGHMHSRGYVHLDVKPENVLVTEKGNATLIDLALAQPIGKPGFLRSIKTRLTGETVGTRSYMSPEQITGGALGPPADIYSLGIVIFEMFARRLPLTATDPNAILQLHLKVQPPMLHHVVPEIHPELSQLVARMLEKTPETRPQTMEVVIDTLARIGKPYLAAPPKAQR